jgi:ABC-2 type transport system ATP-binding protein
MTPPLSLYYWNRLLVASLPHQGTGMPEGAVITNGLTKDFGHFRAVDSINLDIKDGELFGLLGPNGAGKSTTVRMLCTLVEPTAGTASIVGYDLQKNADEVRRHIGVVSDGISLYKDLTIQENLKLLATLYEIPGPQADSRIKELLDMFAFKEKANRMVGALSSGWTKKAMICGALLHRPSVLFLDEVTSGLDPQSAIALQDFTRNLCDQGVTVIWTTHYMSEPDKICDRIAIMFAGRLVQIGTPDELKESISELSVVEVETPDLSQEQLRKVKEKLGNYKIKYENSLLKVTTERNDNLAEEVASALIGIGAKIRKMNTKEPTLEEAFIALTGGEEEIDRFMESATQKK